MFSPVSLLIRQKLNLNELSSLLALHHRHRNLIKPTSAYFNSQYSSIRKLHFSSRLEDKGELTQKTSRHHLKKQTHLTRKDPESEKIIPTDEHGAPITNVQERETVFPPHDPSRTTPVGRQMERKAFNLFDDIAKTRGKNKESFLATIDTYIAKETLYRRGATELIYVGLSEMKNYGVHRDLDAYKALLKAFPVEKMVAIRMWQTEFMHYPRQQQCAIDLQEQLEKNSLCPDEEFGEILAARFGKEAYCYRKYRRLLYWAPKFKSANPYPIPYDLPEDPAELALLALRRMCSYVDRETTYSVWKTVEEEIEPEEDTFIASAQSPIQQELIKKHNGLEPLILEGPFPVYLRMKSLQYFILRAEPNINAIMKEKQLQKDARDTEKLFDWTNFFDDEECKEIRPVLSVHEQDDGTILALGITGSSSKTSIVSWVRLLERTNPALGNIPVLFKISDGDMDVMGDNRSVKELTAT